MSDECIHLLDLATCTLCNGRANPRRMRGGSMSNNWVPVVSYELIHHAHRWLIVSRGGDFYREGIPIDEISYKPIAEAPDYGSALKIIRALRATLPKSGEATDE